MLTREEAKQLTAEQVFKLAEEGVAKIVEWEHADPWTDETSRYAIIPVRDGGGSR